jgi:anti-anti-sigma factor
VLPPAFRLSLSVDVDHATLHVAGELDVLTAAALGRAVDAALGERLASVTVDLRDATFVGLAGLAVLIAAAGRAAGRGTALRVVPGDQPVFSRVDVAARIALAGDDGG